MNEVNVLLRIRRKCPFLFLKRILTRVIRLYGAHVPIEVLFLGKFHFVHNGVGTVITPKTIIHNNVKIYQNETIGRSNVYERPCNDYEGFEIMENAIICAGAKILCKHGKVIIGKNSVVGANCVLTHSIGENEIWGVKENAKRLR